jgi:deoxyxylulose-5-phosphate synthase
MENLVAITAHPTNGSGLDLFLEDGELLDTLAAELLPRQAAAAVACWGSAGCFGSFSTFGGCAATFSSGSTASTAS